MIKEKIVLPDVQIQWLKKHFKHTKNDVIRERLGLSHSTLHRIARELGLKKTRQFMAKMQMAASIYGEDADGGINGGQGSNRSRGRGGKGAAQTASQSKPQSRKVL